MSDFIVTLSTLREADACESGMVYLLNIVGVDFPDDAPIDLGNLTEVKGFLYALWALRCVLGHDRDKRLYAVACARRVQHLMTDERSIDAINVAERYANGNASDDELNAATHAAAYAAHTTAAAAERQWQYDLFIAMCEGQAPWQHQQGE